jgi:hypothetical protein
VLPNPFVLFLCHLSFVTFSLARLRLDAPFHYGTFRWGMPEELFHALSLELLLDSPILSFAWFGNAPLKRRRRAG